MSFETEESVDIELLELLKIHRSTEKVAEVLGNQPGLSSRSIRRRLKERFGDYRTMLTDEADTDIEETPTPIIGGTLEAPDRARKPLSGRRFVFTTAQNNTYIHEDFFAALLQFCEENDAQLIVSRCTYNKSAYQNKTKDSEGLWYDPRLEEYFLDEAVQVAEDLLFCGELDILPTAENPFSGLTSYGMNNSAIVPHVKMRMVSLPRMKYAPPRFMYTTGAVTQRNYIQRKAGQKAAFHHVFGALYVEIDDDGEWFARQLIADSNGEFYDLSSKYTPTGVVEEQRIEAVNWGDIHVECLDHEVAFGSIESNDSILKTLKPKYQFIHDLIDFRARNHHNINDPYFIANTEFRNANSVKEGIVLSSKFLEIVHNPETFTVVVESNHDLALEKWLKTADITKDPVNAVTFHTLNALTYAAMEDREDDFSVFKEALSVYGSCKYNQIHDKIIFLREDDSFVICAGHGGIECGMHGHLGPNGSRGGPQNLKNTGRKCNIGHGHAAGIYDGLYSAGVMCNLDMGYNKGPSSWSHSHVITYQNGKRAIITMRGKKWRA